MGHAAHAVAALPDLAAIGIEDAIAEIHPWPRRRFQQQDLVTSNTAPSVSEQPELRLGQGRRRARRIDHDKVVAERVHLGEGEVMTGH